VILAAPALPESATAATPATPAMPTQARPQQRGAVGRAVIYSEGTATEMEGQWRGGRLPSAIDEGCLGNGAVASNSTDSLNSDPYNLRAEELAMEDCTIGVEVRRTWTEKEMVRAFDGRMFSGTPDGMFEDWNGSLTCVQVVRVPLISGSSISDSQETLVLTILTKIVKSQQWLKASHFEPSDFIIFCWLPFTIPVEVAEHAENAMQLVKQMDPRFSLRLRVPADSDSLFPAMFATNHSVDAHRKRSFEWSDVATYTGSDGLESDEDDFCPWDITWAWDEDIVEDLPDTDVDVTEEVVTPTDSVASVGWSDVEEEEWSTGDWEVALLWPSGVATKASDVVNGDESDESLRDPEMQTRLLHDDMG